MMKRAIEILGRKVATKHAVLGACALLAVGGLAHWRSHATKCPFELDASPAKLEEIRQARAASLRQGERSKARPASGLVLERTTKADLQTWATAAGLTCEEEMRG